MRERVGGGVKTLVHQMMRLATMHSGAMKCSWQSMVPPCSVKSQHNVAFYRMDMQLLGLGYRDSHPFSYWFSRGGGLTPPGQSM